MATAMWRDHGSDGGGSSSGVPRWDPRPLSPVVGATEAEATQQVHPAQPAGRAEAGPSASGCAQARPDQAGRLRPVLVGCETERRSGRDGDELSSARLLRPAAPVPRSGWRAALYTLSGGLLNPGESQLDLARRELRERASQRLTGCYRLAVVSVKGGVGKTSTTTLLGSTFASVRGDRVVALDANPDRGNLARKAPAETSATVRHLLADAQYIRTAADVRAYTSQSPSRLEVVASEGDPAASEAFSAEDYRGSSELLAQHYNLLLTDCGTGILAEALQAAVHSADSLLIVTSASIDGAESAQATVEWLEAHGLTDLVARSVTVINGVRPGRMSVDLDTVERYFAAHTREVVRLPWDPHVEQGGEIHLEQLSRNMRDSLLTLAATVADDFPRRARPSRAAGGGGPGPQAPRPVGPAESTETS